MDSVRSVSPGTSSCKSESGLDSPDSSESDEVDSDDDNLLLSTPNAVQIDVKIWQNMYIEFLKNIAQERVRFWEHVSAHTKLTKILFLIGYVKKQEHHI